MSFVRTWPCSDDTDDAATPQEHEWSPAVATTHRTALRQVHGADLRGDRQGGQIDSVRGGLASWMGYMAGWKEEAVEATCELRVRE